MILYEHGPFFSLTTLSVVIQKDKLHVSQHALLLSVSTVLLLDDFVCSYSEGQASCSPACAASLCLNRSSPNIWERPIFLRSSMRPHKGQRVTANTKHDIYSFQPFFFTISFIVLSCTSTFEYLLLLPLCHRCYMDRPVSSIKQLCPAGPQGLCRAFIVGLLPQARFGTSNGCNWGRSERYDLLSWPHSKSLTFTVQMTKNCVCRQSQHQQKTV